MKNEISLYNIKELATALAIYSSNDYELYNKYMLSRGFSVDSSKRIYDIFYPYHPCAVSAGNFYTFIRFLRKSGEHIYDMFIKLFPFFGKVNNSNYTPYSFIIFPIVNNEMNPTNFIIRMCSGTSRFMCSMLGYINTFGEFCLNKNKNKHMLFITEGLFDAMTLIAEGFDAIAILGTGNVDNADVSFITKYDSVYIIFDNDKAGNSAAIKMMSKITALYNVKTFYIKLKNVGSMNKTDVNDYKKIYGQKFIHHLFSAISGARSSDIFIDRVMVNDYNKMKNKKFINFIETNCSMLDVYKAFYNNGKVGKSTDRYTKCKCPFHNDGVPSLVIYKDTNTCKCFVCGEFRTPVSFVASLYNIKFNEAKKLIEERLK